MNDENNEYNSITTTISKEITSTSLDLTIDYAELTLDEIIDADFLKEIPIVKTLYSIGRIGFNIKERYFIKKLFVFLKEFHSGKVKEERLTKFKTKFSTDTKYRNKITEHIIVYIDSFLEVEKSKILAKLFKAHLDGQFGWEYYVHLSTCLNSLHPKGFAFLKVLAEHDFTIAEDRKEDDLQRDFEHEPLLSAAGIAYDAGSWSSGFYVNDLGKDLFNFGIK